MSKRSPFKCIWELASDAGDQQRVVPDGHMEIVFHRQEPFEHLRDGCWQAQPEAVIAGQITRPVLLHPTGSTRTIGIRLKSWAAGALFRANASDFTNQIVDVRDLNGDLHKRLSRIVAQGGLEAMASRLETEFCDVYQQVDSRVIRAVQIVGATGGSIPVERLASLSGISSRQLARHFLQSVGVSPKSFLRIRRFSEIFSQLSNISSWADVAAECGYADQSHLMKDFRDFAGETPGRALAVDSDLAFHFLPSAAEDVRFLQSERLRTS